MRNLHLFASAFLVVPTAFIYCVPRVLAVYLDIQIFTIDGSSMLKSIACLYLSSSAVWVLGIWKAAYWKEATQLCAFFMLALATGRGASIFLDGFPSNGYIFGMIAELILGLFSIFQLKKYEFGN